MRGWRTAGSARSSPDPRPVVRRHHGAKPSRPGSRILLIVALLLTATAATLLFVVNGLLLPSGLAGLGLAVATLNRASVVAIVLEQRGAPVGRVLEELVSDLIGFAKAPGRRPVPRPAARRALPAEGAATLVATSSEEVATAGHTGGG